MPTRTHADAHALTASTTSPYESAHPYTLTAAATCPYESAHPYTLAAAATNGRAHSFNHTRS